MGWFLPAIETIRVPAEEASKLLSQKVIKEEDPPIYEAGESEWAASFNY